jgi:SGT1 protein
MDIFSGRPPAISEDTLQYSIFPSPQVTGSEASCAALATQIHNTVGSLLPKSFLWHRDAFELKVVQTLPYETTQKSQWKLEGTMRVGDSVDDEWCVVWLLRELTKIFDVAVRYALS